jgi:uncharacterized protein YxeA
MEKRESTVTVICITIFCIFLLISIFSIKINVQTNKEYLWKVTVTYTSDNGNEQYPLTKDYELYAFNSREAEHKAQEVYNIEFRNFRQRHDRDGRTGSYKFMFAVANRTFLNFLLNK